MAKDLIICEPIKIPFRRQKKGNAKHIDAQHVAAFWAKPQAAEIAQKQGCYIFALQAAKGYSPWYVGKATKSFGQEALGNHQRNHYNAVLFDGRKGTPVLFFVAPQGNKMMVPPSVCDEIETYLIQCAFAENPLIRNRQKTKMPAWTIKGVIRPKRGPVPKTAANFKLMMGIQ